MRLALFVAEFHHEREGEYLAGERAFLGGKTLSRYRREVRH